MPQIRGHESPGDGPDPVELLRDLIRFDTSNPPGNERDAMEFIGKVLMHAGIESSLVARDEARPNLVARVEGSGDAAPLLLFGHIDVVTADAARWRYSPFAAELADGEVWGRGALDMKSGVAMLVSSLIRKARSEVRAAGDLLLVVTSDEECGSDLGACFLVDEHPALFDGVRYAIGEGGGFTIWIGGRPFYPIQVAEKQACSVRATIIGHGGHPSVGAKGTATAQLARFISRLERRGLPTHISPVAREMLDGLADDLPAPYRIGLRPLVTPSLTRWISLALGDAGMTVLPLLRNTAVPTAIEGGTGGNVVPTTVTVDLDCRLVPGQTPEGLIGELEAIGPVGSSFELLRVEPATAETPDLTLLPLLVRILRERDPAGVAFPALLPGYTDARHFARLGIQSYGFLPLKLPRGFPPDLIHGVDERVPAEAVRFGADCLVDLFGRYGRSTE